MKNRKKAFCAINGKILSMKEASIGISDLGLQRGYGIFDYIRMYNGKLFHPEDYLRRFRHSAFELHLKLPFSDQQIIEMSYNLINKSNLHRPAIRLILTGGYSNTIPMFKFPNFIMIAEELPTYPSEVYTFGGKLITYLYQRELPHIKSLNYLNAIRLEPLRQNKTAFDILYHWKKKLTECPRNNFFIFCGDTLVTPKKNILLGITRNLILQLAREHFSIEERTIHFNDLYSIDEAFITSTSKGVVPIVRIDNIEIGNGSIGKRTKKIMNLFRDYTKTY
jgi:branched-subunit amino acid aminotransferase/4-amino-4-deoxychorismate lyase